MTSFLKKILHNALSSKLSGQASAFRRDAQRAIATQQKIFSELLSQAQDTDFGKSHGFSGIKNYTDFTRNVPVSLYQDLEPYIQRSRQGESNVLWPGKIRWFAKSGGTTSSKSKFIPVSRQSLYQCHIKVARDLVGIYLLNNPDSKLFTGKSLRLGGSMQQYGHFGTNYGDLSAILITNTPSWADFCSTPSRKIAVMADWNEKLPAMVEEISRQNVTSIAGVPSWMLILLSRTLEYTGKKDLLELWPDFELYMHGGVSFAPYKEQYEKLFPSDRVKYYETYNASEGFFAFQDTNESKDMLLLTDHGIFYEFIPLSELSHQTPSAVPLWEVEKGVNYAVVITTNGGLWRYLIGDTVRFVSTDPYRIRISGRTKHFINCFGEELIVENAEQALKEACRVTGAVITEYTAGPVYMSTGSSGTHEWIVEFASIPSDMELFIDTLDRVLKEVNSDYEAKRLNNMTLQRPLVRVAQPGLFYRWMESRGKLGGQNKVPRLANNRDYLDSILSLMQ